MLTTIHSLQSQIKSGQITIEVRVQNYFKKIQTSKHNAFLALNEIQALESARAWDAKIKAQSWDSLHTQYPLLGCVIGIKDNLVTKNLKTTCASKILEGYLPPYTATVVERLINAGAIVLGKLNMDEFAMGGSNENSAYGPVLHPTHPDRVPGGSSGGSASAVRAGLCDFALGSDTGGSIRLPAGYCGVVGVKPTYGRVSRYGLVAFGSSLDQVGPLCSSVEDAEQILKVIAGHDSKDSTSLPLSWGASPVATSKKLGPLRVGVPSQFKAAKLQPQVRASFERAIEALAQTGAQIKEVSLPNVGHSVAVYYVIAVSEASSNLSRFDGVRYGPRPELAVKATQPAEFYQKVRALFGPEVKRRLLLGTYTLSAGYRDAYYKKAALVRAKIAQDFTQAFNEVDIILSPVASGVAFKLGEKAGNPLEMYQNDLFTIPANLAGIPAMSLPMGQDDQGLPIGIQLMAPLFEDQKMLEVAKLLEKSTLNKGGA